MVSWYCKRCGANFFSSYAQNDKRWVICPVCGFKVPNSYYSTEARLSAPAGPDARGWGPLRTDRRSS